MHIALRSLGNRWGLGSVVAVALALAVAGTAAAADKLTFTSGSVGGGYFKAAAAFAEIIKKDVPDVTTTVIPGGGWANVERLESGFADVAVLENALATLAYRGQGPTGKQYDFRMLASVRGPSIAQAVIATSTGITSFEEIKEKKYPIRIAMFERQQLATGQALDLLAAYGITPQDIEAWGGKVIFTSLDEGIRMIMDGLADMWFTGSSYFPHHKYVELGTKLKFRLLPISKEVAQKVAEKYGQDIMEVPADIYKDSNGVNEAYWSPVTIIAFGVRTDLSEDLVYKMTKALADHKKEFWEVNPQHKFYQPKTAWKHVGAVPLHPGAERYYREMGYMPKQAAGQ